MQVTINIQELKQISTELKEYQEHLENTSPLMEEMANHLTNIIKESFEKHQTPTGKPWQPIKERKGDRTPNKILYDEGDLQEKRYSNVTDDTVIIGFSAKSESGYPYAIVHQFGSEDGTIPDRAFLPIHKDGSLYDEVEKELIEIVEDFINL